MSHALHALSDGVINYSQAPPREVRARPFLIQSMVQSAVMQGLPIHVAQRAATMAAASQPTTSARYILDKLYHFNMGLYQGYLNFDLGNPWTVGAQISNILNPDTQIVNV